MGKDTSIQWADSSLQLQSGCDGCELWNSKVKICYAGKMIDGDGNRPGFRGKKGWPVQFDQPTLFLDRLAPALKWADLTGTNRAEKPWLNRYPRIIFLNDMGDTFSRKLPLNWMAPILPLLAASPHQWLILTKRPSRLVEFSERFPLPENVWPGTSVTSDATARRVDELRKVEGGGPKFVSFEPLWSGIPVATFAGIKWAIFGGESGGEKATRLDTRWINDGIDNAYFHGAAPFVKQLGSNPYFTDAELKDTPLKLKDSHGGDPEEWHEELRVREMPRLALQPTLL